MSATPAISIVLPLYNAVAHLPTGLKSISDQTFKDFEIVAVNDGSTDRTVELFSEMTASWQQKIKLIHRTNGGGFAARNTGLDNVSGSYIAFFDIDDRWYPNHLERLHALLNENPDVDWVYASCKLIDLTENERVVAESNFYDRGKAKRFMELSTEDRGGLKVINDPRAAAYQFVGGLQLGQQFSLVRSEVFKTSRFRSDYRNEGADQVALITALKSGVRIAYIDELHGEYAIHGGNASAGCKGAPFDKYLRLRKALIRGFKELDSEVELSVSELRALNERIGSEYFWQLAYNLYLQNGDYKEARRYFELGLFHSPFDLKKWKTYFLFRLRSALRKGEVGE